MLIEHVTEVTTSTGTGTGTHRSSTLRADGTMQDFIAQMMLDGQPARAILNFSVNMPAEYRSPFDTEIETATDYRQYQPNFYLTDHGIYIERFALNENGKAPTGWTGYEDGIAWKREQHSRSDTTLVHFLNHTKSSNISQAEIDRRSADSHNPRKGVSQDLARGHKAVRRPPPG